MSPPILAATSLLMRDPDWPVIVAQADRHGLAAILHDHLSGVPHGAIPREAREALAAAARRCVARNLRLRHELGRVLAAFEGAGIAAMPLKGPVLADRLYPAPLLRETGDLDVLVRACDASAADAALATLGYAPRPDGEQGADYHTVYAGDSGIDVELHVALGERHVTSPDVRAIWTAATPGRWNGHVIWSMAVCDELVYLAFHAVKDGLASLRSLVDIALLVERHGATLAWPTIAERVRAAHLAPVSYLALAETRALLGCPVPDAFLDAIRPRYAGWALAQWLYRWRGGLLHAADELCVGPFMAALMMLWEDSPGARLRHITRNLVPSARLRSRWTAAAMSASWLTWYPAWVAHAVHHLVRQLVTRRASSRVA